MSRSLLKVRAFAAKYQAFSEGSLRWMIFNANSNGLAASGAILRNGRSVILDEERFLAWLESRQPSASHAAA